MSKSIYQASQMLAYVQRKGASDVDVARGHKFKYLEARSDIDGYTTYFLQSLIDFSIYVFAEFEFATLVPIVIAYNGIWNNINEI
jgi:hypothetical protein